MRKTRTQPKNSSPIESPILRSGKDELNLAEYPFSVLYDGSEVTTVIYHEWDIPSPKNSKDTLKASWRVAGDPELGLPHASDLRVYLALLELTREANFPQKVPFTRYELLKRLGWPDDKPHYEMLYRSLQRLKNVSITAKHSFRDAQKGLLDFKTFSILDDVEIVYTPRGIFADEIKEMRVRVDETNLEIRGSFFKWNDVIYRSIRSGYLSTIDLDFALNLKNDVALALYRLLSKKSYGNRASFEMELHEFYHRHLGLRAVRYPSKMKERLAKGHKELIDKGFLTEVRYEEMRSRVGEKIVYVFKGAKKLAEPQVTSLPLSSLQQELPFESANQSGTEHNEDLPELLKRIVALSVSFDVAQTLFATVDHEFLTLQLDCLPKRKAKDAPAIFVASVKGKWEPPAAYVAEIESKARLEEEKELRRRSAEIARAAAQLKTEKEALERKEIESLNTRWESLDKSLQDEIDKEVENRLGFLVNNLGKAATKSAFEATRRQVLRERIEIGNLDSSGNVQAQPPLLDSELDLAFEALSQNKQAEIEEKVRQRLNSIGMSQISSTHMAWIGVRRTILRDSRASLGKNEV